MRILSEFRRHGEQENRETRRERRERTRWEEPMSLWRDRGRRISYPAPSTDIDADVVIVGAGFTGLWTAVLIAEENPGLSVAVLEAAQPGFGASGRNGGWCSALLPASDDVLDRTFGPGSATALHSAARESVDLIGEYARRHSIDCSWEKGGTLTVATNLAQLERLRGSSARDPRVELLDEAALHARVRIEGARGALFDPECAALDPVALLQGLLDRCRELGVRVFGATRVVTIGRDHVIADGAAGLVYATTRQIVLATEAYVTRLKRQRRRLAPLYSFVVATDPLPQRIWEEIGWEGRETIGEAGHMVTYAQRTLDGRIVFGGRGAPYAFGSDIHSSRDVNDEIHDRIVARMNQLFPATVGVRISHRWGGPLGLPRDHMPGVWVDEETGAIHAGGYTGDGVALSHLIARIVCTRVCGNEDPAASLPLNGHRPRRWEPEPFRWLGINAGLLAAWRADRAEANGRSARLWSRILDWF